MTRERAHTPVMVQEVLKFLDPRPGMTVVDATVGLAGHSAEILSRVCPGGKLIGIDRDEESLALAREKLGPRPECVELVYGNFSDIDSLLRDRGITRVDGILFDLGVSMFQLQNSRRGFSFQEEGPLDMRLDRNSYISAYDLLNNLNEEEISNLLWSFGEERWHNRIARNLVRQRERHPIMTTKELSDIVVHAVPPKYRSYRIHPATRTFQAIRIAVNRELEALETAVNKSVDFLSSGATICVISFHSLEDRIVKQAFKRLHAEGKLSIVTPKPLTPTSAESASNPSARSAKLRAARKP